MRRSIQGHVEHRLGLAGTEGGELVRQHGILDQQRATAKRPALAAPASPMAKVATDALGHLHDGEQRILPRQRLRLHRHAEHRQRGLGRDHARQVGGTAGARDDRL